MLRGWHIAQFKLSDGRKEETWGREGFKFKDELWGELIYGTRVLMMMVAVM